MLVYKYTDWLCISQSFAQPHTPERTQSEGLLLVCLGGRTPQ